MSNLLIVGSLFFFMQLHLSWSRLGKNNFPQKIITSYKKVHKRQVERISDSMKHYQIHPYEYFTEKLLKLLTWPS